MTVEELAQLEGAALEEAIGGLSDSELVEIRDKAIGFANFFSTEQGPGYEVNEARHLKLAALCNVRLAGEGAKSNS